MSTTSALSDEAIIQRLQQTPQWELKENKLYRRLMFEDFRPCLRFYDSNCNHR
ncbi:hypothetical protein [Oceanicoccus sp. KOV_DT_Chl]|uniref:hypothetical protein n=1 Tax=Oceanicoccus sp. KOV_DT_Chl TaxID=1904639 RepID=UPI003510446C